MKKFPSLVLLTALIVSACGTVPTVTPTIETPHTSTAESATVTPAPPSLPFRMEKSSQQFTASETFQTGLGDLDNDGDLDIFVGSLGSKPIIWINLTNE
jgi:hypothetical protein